jgi:two-component system sensor histidine kinase ChvG
VIGKPAAAPARLDMDTETSRLATAEVEAEDSASPRRRDREADDGATRRTSAGPAEMQGDPEPETAEGGDAVAAAGILPRLRWFAGRVAAGVRHTFFSSLTRRILFLNVTAIAVLLSAILYLNQFRQGLIDARVESLLIEGRIIASAIAASATADTNTILVDPDKLIELQAGESVSPTVDTLDTLDSPIEAEKVAPLLRNLIQPTRTRARIYDRDGILILDSRHLYSGGVVLRFDLPRLNAEPPGMIERIGRMLNRWLQRRDLPVYKDLSGRGTEYPEVKQALAGPPSSIVRMTQQGELVVNVAVPVQRFRAVLGVLLLSTQGNDIDRIVAEERIAILRIFLVAGGVLIVLSVLLASTIANPLRKLAEAAVSIRQGAKARVQIPDYSHRPDEIGNLSSTLREMTDALYARIEAIERFAADVSHELKNPLTSLRSAVETLPIARSEESRKRLLEIIQHDVRRLDRLITDISDASRLDAELAREDSAPVRVDSLLESLVDARSAIARPGRNPQVVLDVARARAKNAYLVAGHEIRIGQVVNNLLDNASSFVPANGGRIDIALRRRGARVEIEVSDNGPGIPDGNFERIFERFYTDRPEEEGFGQNSGLGLSISRQIVEAHGGTITVRNRKPPATGACFTVSLPVAKAG